MVTPKSKKQPKANYSEILNFVTTKEFAKANLGITDKTSFDWRNQGLYLQEKKSKQRMKYSPVEYIWLLLVKECRMIGLPIKSLITLKSILTIEADVEALLVAFQNLESKSNSNAQDPNTKQQKAIQNQLKRDINNLDEHLVKSIFTSMIISTLQGEKDYLLFIKKDGSCLIETIGEGQLDFSGFLSETCVMVPFRKIVTRFLKQENIEVYDHYEKTKNPFDKITQTFDFDYLKDGYVKK
jgi:DNA-binding transcriptional MerR regulator